MHIEQTRRTSGIWSVLLPLFFILPCELRAQNYQAIHGSNYAGGLGTHLNPASIIQSPDKWDITLMGIQGKFSTNFFYSIRNDLFSFPTNYKYNFSKGNDERYAHANANINLVNTRLSLGRNRAIAFGSNIRAYANGNTSRLLFKDTAIDDLDGIISSNWSNQPFSAKVVANAMWEGYFSYAQILLEDPRYRLNAGATFKFSRGLTGGMAGLEQLRFGSNSAARDARYFYSSNYDKWKPSRSLIRNLYNFTYYTQGGSSIDLGLELLIKTQATTTFYDEDDFYDYRWKISLSLMDIGYNKFRYGYHSRYINTYDSNLTYSFLKEKINYQIKGIEQFNDSLGSVTGLRQFDEKYNVVNPARLILNADYFVNRDLYINTELSLNMGSLISGKWNHVTDISFITVTPRWENKAWGIYLPFSLTDQKRFWVGGAIKAGPLLIGIHNLKYLFSAKSMQNGGGYVALTLRSPARNTQKPDKWMALFKH